MLGHYQIYLIAKDGGQPQRSSMLTINVTVSDINDNKEFLSPMSLSTAPMTEYVVLMSASSGMLKANDD
jgi:hypothetical protein